MFQIKIFFLLSIIFLFFPENIHSQKYKVFHGFITEEIELGLAPYVKRVIAEAEAANADVIIFEINTFGGRVDAATQIKDAILDSKIETIAFVNKRAVSAGALITISCKNVAMAPGSVIGAATVVDQSGAKGSEKYQSYMRSEMRSTAERNGRNVLVAEAMVDERIEIPGLVDSSQLVSLTSEQAIKYGISDTIVNSVDEALKAFGYKDYEIVETKVSWAENVVRFLNNPIIASLLITLGLVGLFTEIKSPGWGIAGTVGIIALTLFFGSSIILQLASWLEVILFVAGLVLILVEIFVVPGFGIPGISGIALMVIALFLSLFDARGFVDWGVIQRALIQFAASILGAAILFSLIYRYLPKSKAFQTFVLPQQFLRSEGYFSNNDNTLLLNQSGIAFTDLRPAGTAKISGTRYDVVSTGDYIERGSQVKVVKIEGVKIFVEKIA